MIGAGSQSWNLRDKHMTQILEYLMKFLECRKGKPVKAVVWVS